MTSWENGCFGLAGCCGFSLFPVRSWLTLTAEVDPRSRFPGCNVPSMRTPQSMLYPKHPFNPRESVHQPSSTPASDPNHDLTNGVYDKLGERMLRIGRMLRIFLFSGAGPPVGHSRRWNRGADCAAARVHDAVHAHPHNQCCIRSIRSNRVNPFINRHRRRRLSGTSVLKGAPGVSPVPLRHDSQPASGSRRMTSTSRPCARYCADRSTRNGGARSIGSGANPPAP
jgi:hypothetical protein